MKRKMIVAAVALLMTSGVAYAVEPGSIHDSPANWTAKTWAAMCTVCVLREQDNVCRPDFRSLIALRKQTAKTEPEEQARHLSIRCNACAARECLIEDDAAQRE